MLFMLDPAADNFSSGETKHYKQFKIGKRRTLDFTQKTATLGFAPRAILLFRTPSSGDIPLLHKLCYT